jgi:uncharacterized protein
VIAEGLAVLIHYTTYLSPGVLLFGLWFALTPKAMPAMRILILLAAFVLMRDVMTPLGLWTLGSGVQIGFTANAFVLAALGGLSVLLILLLAYIAPDLWRLVRWTIGSPSAFYGYWVWLPAMVVLAYGANALEEVLFRGFLQGYLEQQLTPLRAALTSGVAFAACHAFLALSVTQLGWPVLVFTLIEGVACGLVRMRYGVLAATVTHGTAILLVAVPYIA